MLGLPTRTDTARPGKGTAALDFSIRERAVDISRPRPRPEAPIVTIQITGRLRIAPLTRGNFDSARWGRPRRMPR